MIVWHQHPMIIMFALTWNTVTTSGVHPDCTTQPNVCHLTPSLTDHREENQRWVLFNILIVSAKWDWEQMESSESWEKEPLSLQKSQTLLSLPRNRSLCVKVRYSNTTQIFLIKFTFILQFYIATPSTVVSYMCLFFQGIFGKPSEIMLILE